MNNTRHLGDILQDWIDDQHSWLNRMWLSYDLKRIMNRVEQPSPVTKKEKTYRVTLEIKVLAIEEV